MAWKTGLLAAAMAASCLYEAQAQGTIGGGNTTSTPGTSPFFLALPYIRPIITVGGASGGGGQITGYNVTVDLLSQSGVNPPVAPQCTLKASFDGVVFDPRPLTSATATRGPATGYRYVLRFNARFVNATSPVLAPQYLRVDCLAGSGAPGGLVPTAPLALLGGVSPMIHANTSRTFNVADFPSGIVGPIIVQEFGAHACTPGAMYAFALAGGQVATIWNGPSMQDGPVSDFCAYMANATVQNPRAWHVYLYASDLTGGRLPVTFMVMDSASNKTIAATPMDRSPTYIVPTFTVGISAVDVYTDSISGTYTRFSRIAGANSTTVRDVPASPSRQTTGRVIVTLTGPLECPRIELRTNSTSIMAWSFAATAASQCGPNATVLGFGNTAELKNFPSSGYGGGSALDRMSGLGYRLLVADLGIAASGVFYFPGDNEMNNGHMWLLRYASPSVTSISPLFGSTPGPYGAPAWRVNVTATNLGPTDGPFHLRPTAQLNSRACLSADRTGPDTVTVTLWGASGNNVYFQLFAGDQFGTGQISFPAPTVSGVEIATAAQWSAAAAVAAYRPQSISLATVTGHVATPATVDVQPGDVVLVRGRGFGAWSGAGVLSLDPVNPMWQFDSYGANTRQCVAVAWAGRSSGLPAPTCNGAWDFAGEGELPPSGSILYYNDSLVVFRAPPSSPGYRDVVLVLGGGVTTMPASTSWYNVPILLRYQKSMRVDSFAFVPLNAGATRASVTGGGDSLVLSGPGFVRGLVAPTSLTYPYTFPTTYSGLAALPEIAFGMLVFRIGGANSNLCALSTSAATSAFGTTTGYVNSASVPAACRPGFSGALPTVPVVNGTATVSLPAGNGQDVPIVTAVFDAIPDPIRGMMQIVTLNADGSGGVGVLPTFSYASPAITALTPSVVSVTSNLAATTTRLTLSGTSLGAEDAASCTTAPSVPAMAFAVDFTPLDATYAVPLGGYSLVPEAGGALTKVFSTSPCGVVTSVSGLFPNLAVGRYGVTVNATSAWGSRAASVPAAQGVAYTCGASYYGREGQLCMSCAAFTGATCPGGNATFDAADLSAPVVASAGYYNFRASEATACPSGTSATQNPAGRDVCVAQCGLPSACAGGNRCQANYTSLAPSYGCSHCAPGFARVNDTACSSGLSQYVGMCVAHSVCTDSGASIAGGSGRDGEDLCWCSGEAAPTPSATPSPSPSPVAASSTPSVSPTPTASGTPAGSATATPTASRTPSASPTPSPSNHPSSCADGVKNGDETDVDCGGSSSGCARCSAGLMCLASTDCIGASGGQSSDAVCADSTKRCADVRTTSGYWDSIVSGNTGATTGGPSVLLFNVALTATVSDAALTTSGLEALRSALETVAAQQLRLGGIAADAISVAAALASVTRTGASAGARRMLTGDVQVDITSSIAVAPGSGATSTWDEDVLAAVNRGAFSPSTLAGPLQANLASLSGAGASAWNQALAGTGGSVSLQPATQVTPYASIVTVEAARNPAAGAGAGASAGAAVFIVALACIVLGYVMFTLRTHGEIMGRRMKPVATLCGMWPLSPRVQHNLRTRAGMYGRKVSLSGKAPAAQASDSAQASEPVTFYNVAGPYGSQASAPSMMPYQGPPGAVPYMARATFAPSSVDSSRSFKATSLYVNPAAAARQGIAQV
jgi:hypothetical protein